MVCSNSSLEVEKAISWFLWVQNEIGCGSGYGDTQRMEGEWFQDESHASMTSSKRVLDGGIMGLH